MPAADSGSNVVVIAVIMQKTQAINRFLTLLPGPYQYR